MAKQSKRFEGACTCGGRVTGNGTDRPWRHDAKATDGHQAHPIGTLKQI